MSQPRLLLVDPHTPRRRDFAAALANDFAVFAVGAIGEAAAQEPPDVAILALRQAGAHGLELGKDMKLKCPVTRVLVYGATETTRTVTRERVQAKWGVDAYLPFIPDSHDLLAATIGLARPLRPVVARAALPPVVEKVDDEPTWSDLLKKDLSTDVLRQVMTKPLFGRARGS